MKFRKPLVTAGTYGIDDEQGVRQKHTISTERLRHWQHSWERMLAKGRTVPCPVKHDLSSLPKNRQELKQETSKLKIGRDGSLPNSLSNVGFVEKVWLDGDTLWGEIEVPGKLSDPNSLASRIGNTIRETSIYVRPTFTDSDGEVFEDALMHVALVTHPIEPGQGNFEPVEQGALALAMSQLSPESGTSDPDSPEGTDSVEGLSPLLQLLQKVAKITLPPDTTDQNLQERLYAALLQKQTSEEELNENTVPETSPVRKPPEGAKTQNAPVTMSLTQKQKDSLLKVLNPETGKNFTASELDTVGAIPSVTELSAEVLMAHPVVKQIKDTNTGLLNVIAVQRQAGFLNRIQNLIDKKIITKEYADASLAPMVAGLQMSFGADGKPLPTAIEPVLSALEAMPAPVAPSVPSFSAGSRIPDHMLTGSLTEMQMALQSAGTLQKTPDESGTPPTVEDTAKSVAAFLKNTGF